MIDLTTPGDKGGTIIDKKQVYKFDTILMRSMKWIFTKNGSFYYLK